VAVGGVTGPGGTPGGLIGPGGGAGAGAGVGLGVEGGVGAVSLAQATGIDSKNNTSSPIIIFLIFNLLYYSSGTLNSQGPSTVY